MVLGKGSCWGWGGLRTRAEELGASRREASSHHRRAGRQGPCYGRAAGGAAEREWVSRVTLSLFRG